MPNFTSICNFYFISFFIKVFTTIRGISSILSNCNSRTFLQSLFLIEVMFDLLIFKFF